MTRTWARRAIHRFSRLTCWLMRRLMRDVTWCQMAGWRLRLGQACTMTITRGKPEISTGHQQSPRWMQRVEDWKKSGVSVMPPCEGQNPVPVEGRSQHRSPVRNSAPLVSR